VRVRLLKITGVDLNAFEFDYDLAWAALFLNASGKVYGRYGGRDGKGADTRNTLKGLHYAMAAALAEHRKDPAARPDRPAAEPLYIEKAPTAKTYRGCIHCHQVKEILREEEKKAGAWQRDSIYAYPLPENVGIRLDLDQSNLVREVKAGSAADKAGLKPGDVVQSLHGNAVHSFADAQYALHKSPLTGKIAVAWQRDGKSMDGTLTLQAGWKRTNITWRPSLLDMLPSLTVYGEDLTAREKKALGLGEKRLAFRQQAPVHSAARAMGVQKDDVIIGVDGKVMEMSMEQFLGHVRQNYLIGEPLTINLLRNGKRVDLKVTLK
jgi:predicted metalloprotease with PDZ domain